MPDSRPNHDPQQEAFERGVRRAHVDAELESHEKRLNVINGSIERHARNVDALRRTIDNLSDKLDGIAATLTTRAAVEKSRAEQLTRANDQQISNRTFWLGVVAVIVTLVAAFVASRGVTFR